MTFGRIACGLRGCQTSFDVVGHFRKIIVKLMVRPSTRRTVARGRGRREQVEMCKRNHFVAPAVNEEGHPEGSCPPILSLVRTLNLPASWTAVLDPVPQLQRGECHHHICDAGR
jgi:hypothetical protein